jgi:signal transduction histidine kinase
LNDILLLPIFMGYIISLILAFRLRKFIALEPHLGEKWDSILTRIMVACGLLFIVSQNSFKYLPLFLGGYAILGWLFWKFYKKPDFIGISSLIFSFAPVGIICSLSDVIRWLFPSFYDNYTEYFIPAMVAGWVWLIATLINSRKQMRELKNESEQRQKQEKENKLIAARKAVLELLVQERTSELKEQNEKLKETLDELHAAQVQLIHSEKMASLGELTAGIAHEIQNPLNFVNNFAELNEELVDELMDAIVQKNFKEAETLALAIKDNEQKVAHHGKRADSIVKSMLQHSRGSSVARENIQLNALAEECIRLSYHGMRAKEKSFNAKMELIFSEDVGIVQGVPGDISRVLLNICTNAFYAVLQRAKRGEKDFQPTIWLETGVENEHAWIKIRDNGGGIPAEAMDKIFQPFFTTKPTGEGTGLGLSMSFEIITKGHGGTINVDSKEGEGATFTITLPLSK